MAPKNISILTFLVPFPYWMPLHMNLCHLKRKPGVRSLTRKTLSWVLKLWYFEEAHIPPTIPKNQKFWAIFEKTLISTPTTKTRYTHTFSLKNINPLRVSTKTKYTHIFSINNIYPLHVFTKTKYTHVFSVNNIYPLHESTKMRYSHIFLINNIYPLHVSTKTGYTHMFSINIIYPLLVSTKQGTLIYIFYR